MTVPHSTPAGRARKSGRPNKPAKPSKHFPLTAHASGQWCKKILGKIHYFGKWDQPQAALERWLEEKDHLLAGLAPPAPANDVGLRVRDLVNQFMDARMQGCLPGESPRTPGAITILHAMSS
jgi:hypothetical protein